MKIFQSKKKEKLVTIGDVAPDFELVDHQCKKFKLSSFRGWRVILSFYRFAACPICTYNVDRLKQQAAIFEQAGVVTLCIFKSTPQIIAKFSLEASGRSEDAALNHLSDKKGSVFKAYMVPKSTKAAINGNIEVFKNLRKYKQFSDVSLYMKDSRGGTNMSQARQLPADFMIDEDGVIVDLFRAEKMIDHMPFERVEAFIPEGKRCRCNKKDCIVPRCRENYNQIRKESEAMLFIGDGD